jgi:hypothetical protein
MIPRPAVILQVHARFVLLHWGLLSPQIPVSDTMLRVPAKVRSSSSLVGYTDLHTNLWVSAPLHPAIANDSMVAGRVLVLHPTSLYGHYAGRMYKVGTARLLGADERASAGQGRLRGGRRATAGLAPAFQHD